MEPEFWKDRWEQRIIGFNQSQPNPLLVDHFHSLQLGEGARVFAPLTGKTIDVNWLLTQGYRVVGVELSETAVKELFEELSITPNISPVDSFVKYSADSIEIFTGDFFDLTVEDLGTIDAVYDRAAIVALPMEMRKRYAEHLMTITGNAAQFIISFDYDQQVVSGPPFSVDEQELRDHYGSHYELQLMESVVVPGGIKFQAEATENAWGLKPRA